MFMTTALSLEISNRVERLRHGDAKLVERRDQLVRGEDLGDVELAAGGQRDARRQGGDLDVRVAVGVGGFVLGARAVAPGAARRDLAGPGNRAVLVARVEDVL